MIVYDRCGHFSTVSTYCMSHYSFSHSSSHHTTVSSKERILALLQTSHIRWLMLCVMMILGIVYIWLVNSSATTGFYLSDMDRYIAKLEQEYQKLELSSASLHSLAHIEEEGKTMNMIAESNAQYVRDGNAVALDRSASMGGER